MRKGLPWICWVKQTRWPRTWCSLLENHHSVARLCCSLGSPILFLAFVSRSLSSALSWFRFYVLIIWHIKGLKSSKPFMLPVFYLVKINKNENLCPFSSLQETKMQNQDESTRRSVLFKIKTHVFTYVYSVTNCTTGFYETTSILLIKMLETLTNSQINLCHFVVQMEHWQIFFQYPKHHFWNKFEVLIHSTIISSTYYVSDTIVGAEQAKWDDFLISEEFRSLKQCFSNYFYSSVPSFDKHKYPSPISQKV